MKIVKITLYAGKHLEEFEISFETFMEVGYKIVVSKLFDIDNSQENLALAEVMFEHFFELSALENAETYYSRSTFSIKLETYVRDSETFSEV